MLELPPNIVNNTKKHQGRYFKGIMQGKQQNRVISYGFLATLCHRNMKSKFIRPQLKSVLLSTIPINANIYPKIMKIRLQYKF